MVKIEEIEWSPRANNNLKEITKYIATDSPRRRFFS